MGRSGFDPTPRGLVQPRGRVDVATPHHAPIVLEQVCDGLWSSGHAGGLRPLQRTVVPGHNDCLCVSGVLASIPGVPGADYLQVA